MRRKTSRARTLPAQVPEDPAKAERDALYDAQRLARSRATQPARLGQDSVRQLVEAVEQGVFRIPPFQRDFVWSDEHILHLLDSLWRGFYVGSLLLWESYDIRPDLPSIGGVVPEDSKRGFLVVDGQQRLKSLHLAFTSRRFAFDAETERFVVDVPMSKTVFPLHLIHGSTIRTNEDMDVLRWIDEAGVGGSIETVARMTDELHYRLLATVRLPHEWALSNVMDMFSRLNTAGIRMDAAEVEDALRRALSTV